MPVFTGVSRTFITIVMRNFSPSLLTLAILLTLPLSAGGCLIAAKKVIAFEVSEDGSGTGKIIYTDLSSLQEDEHDRSLEDYSTMIEEWLNGSNLETIWPGAQNIEKRIFELGGALHGEMTFSFEHYNEVGLYRHDDTGPWMYHAGRHTSNVEGFDTSNGRYGGEMMPVIFWPDTTVTFRIVNGFDPGNRPVRSLHPLYKRLGSESTSEKRPDRR